MAKINELGVDQQGFDLDEIRLLAKELDNIGTRMKRMGIYLFGRGGRGQIRTAVPGPLQGHTVLADLSERNGVWLGSGVMEREEFEDEV